MSDDQHSTESSFAPAATLKDSPDPMYPEGETQPEACAHCRDLRALFDLQYKRMFDATARWRAADPAARENALPDLGDLLAWLMAETDRARVGLDLPAGEMVLPGELAVIPRAYRRLVGRWLAGQATMLKPSWLFSAQNIQLARDVLKGTAVTLAEPLAEDSTIDHAAQMMHEMFFEPEPVTGQQELLRMIDAYADARAAQIEELHATGDADLLAAAEQTAHDRLATIRTALGVRP